MANVCHNAGEYVPRNLGGTWSDSAGHTVHVQGGDVFPPCRHCGHTRWCRET